MADRNSLPEGLLADVKNYLNITWDDTATDTKVSGLIASGMVYLDGKAGGEQDYTADGALEVFETNYMALILGMQNERRVKPYAVEAPVPPAQ